MNTSRNILIAFILNFSFSVFEFFGGLYTGSVAIISDAIHDIGDAMSIGFAYFFEKKSKKQPDDTYTYGYARYSVLGSVFTTLLLIAGSAFVIFNAIKRLIHPEQINYNGMIVFAVIGVCVNLAAVYFTHNGDSLNQKAVNLHMLEDVFGWFVVLIGAIVMRFTNFVFIDPILSLCVAVYIMVIAIKNLTDALQIFLEKAPKDISVKEIKNHLSQIDGVLDIHHIHIWSLDGQNHYATMHIVTNSNPHEIKSQVREELHEHGIIHATLELETENEECHQRHCSYTHNSHPCHHHHHH